MTDAQETLEDLIADAINDSMDMDWTARDGARSVCRTIQPELDALRAELAVVKAKGGELAGALGDAISLVDDINDLINQMSGTRSFAAKLAQEKYRAALSAWEGSEGTAA